MKKTDDLFDLIKSMSKNEKRFFKLFAGISGKDTNYLKLFDAYDKKKEYDEELIKKAISKEKFSSNLAHEKRYLHQQILKSLRNFNADASIKSKARADLDAIEILIHKGLLKQALKRVNQTIQTLHIYDDLAMLLPVYAFKEVIFNRMETEVTDEQWNDYFQKRALLVSQIENMSLYRTLERKLIRINHQGLLKLDKKQSAALDEIRNDKLLKDTSRLNSFDAKYRFNMIQAVLALNDYDYEKEAKSFKAILDLLDNEYKEMKDAYYKEHYFIAYFNYTSALIFANKYREAEKALANLKAIPTTTSLIQNAFAFYYESNTEAMLVIAKGDTKKMTLLIQKISEGLSRYGKQLSLSQLMNTLHDIGHMQFMTERYKEAAKTLNPLLQTYPDELIREKSVFIRLLILLCYFEQNEFDLVEYTLSSTSRYLKKMDRYYLTEKTLLDFFRTCVKKRGASHEDFKKLQTTLGTILKDKHENTSLLYFDFLSWVGSKTQKVPFGTFVAEKAKTKA